MHLGHLVLAGALKNNNDKTICSSTGPVRDGVHPHVPAAVHRMRLPSRVCLVDRHALGAILLSLL